jgi:hypothetical protein
MYLGLVLFTDICCHKTGTGFIPYACLLLLPFSTFSARKFQFTRTGQYWLDDEDFIPSRNRRSSSTRLQRLWDSPIVPPLRVRACLLRGAFVYVWGLDWGSVICTPPNIIPRKRVAFACLSKLRKTESMVELLWSGTWRFTTGRMAGWFWMVSETARCREWSCIVGAYL